MDLLARLRGLCFECMQLVPGAGGRYGVDRKLARRRARMRPAHPSKCRNKKRHQEIA